MFDNDATSYYNRIIPNLSSILAREKVMGVSQESYSHSEMYPIYGSGQGARNSPNILLVISSTLADIFDMEAHGVTFISPDDKINTKLTLLVLVYDVTNQVNEFLNNDMTTTDLALKMEHDSTLWSNLQMGCYIWSQRIQV
eukprot:1228717-Ditylum_brightwellii.AAC.1